MNRIIKEHKKIVKFNENGIKIETVEEYKIYKVYLSKFEKNTQIYKELKKFKIKAVEMEILIEKDYPFLPPFVRVVYPRFIGYVGFITTGGSLCTDILTITGWVPSFNIISLMMQLKVFMKNGKIDSKNYNKKYTLEEAKKHYNHTTSVHKWNKI